MDDEALNKILRNLQILKDKQVEMKDAIAHLEVLVEKERQIRKPTNDTEKKRFVFFLSD